MPGGQDTKTLFFGKSHFASEQHITAVLYAGRMLQGFYFLQQVIGTYIYGCIERQTFGVAEP